MRFLGGISISSSQKLRDSMQRSRRICVQVLAISGKADWSSTVLIPRPGRGGQLKRMRRRDGAGFVAMCVGVGEPSLPLRGPPLPWEGNFMPVTGNVRAGNFMPVTGARQPNQKSAIGNHKSEKKFQKNCPWGRVFCIYKFRWFLVGKDCVFCAYRRMSRTRRIYWRVYTYLR